MLETESVLPLVRQSPAARRFRRIGGNALEESGRIDHAEQGVSMERSALAPDDDPIGLVMAAPPAEFGADALVPRADQGKASKMQKKKMVVALARKLLVALWWRYVDAGVVIEGCAVLKRCARSARRPPPRCERFLTNPPRSDQPRCGRSGKWANRDGLLGLKSRSEEGTRLLPSLPPPAKAESGCGR